MISCAINGNDLGKNTEYQTSRNMVKLVNTKLIVDNLYVKNTFVQNINGAIHLVNSYMLLENSVFDST